MRVPLKKRTAIVFASVIGLLLFALILNRVFIRPSGKVPAGALNLSTHQNIEDFFKAYWQRPIHPQGQSPGSFSEQEARLDPEACGSCHPKQYTDWKESFHSKAMGPGPWGQIVELSRNSPEEAILCMTCHAPLGEQIPWLTANAVAQDKGYAKNPAYDPKLQLQGITCAACHVRQHQRFGPPKAEGTAAPTYPAGIANHGGVERTPYFEKAEFCRDCHQFDPENTALVNGKPLQDTYREWLSSIWGKGEASCQECHMPHRRHLWKGIHDAEWVKGAVRFAAEIRQELSGPKKTLEINVDLINAAVGHKFPTYITPKVFVRAALLDIGGKILPGTQQERVIGWDVRFEDGQWKEYFDTRIAPGEKFQASFSWSPPSQARKIRAWVEVHPDHFYHHHFYPAYLADPSLSPAGKKLIEKALQESGRTPYLLFDRLVHLK